MLEIVLAAIVSAVATVFLMLSVPYMKARVQAIAAEPSQKALAEVRLGHEQILAAINAEHGQRGSEFTLFKQRQHQVYGRMYGKVRIAVDAFGKVHRGLKIGPTFKDWDPDDIRDYLRRRQLRASVGAPAIQALASGDAEEMMRVMSDLDWRADRRDAERAFIKAKNYEAVNELYLSDAVRAAMDEVRDATAKVSVAVDRDEDEGPDQKAIDKQDAMDSARAKLFWTMRAEIQRSETALAKH